MSLVVTSKRIDGSDDYYVHFSIVPSVLTSSVDSRVPADVVVVIDVSGSMGNPATVPGSVENSGLNLLDIVKHAVRTIVATLTDDDRLAIVTYSSQGKKVFDLESMTSENKNRAIDVLTNLRPGGMTNIWDGLKIGMNILKLRETQKSNNSVILLLTDGEPNMIPEGGHNVAMRNYRDSCGGHYPGLINTFAFGYNAQSQIMTEMSTEAGGIYAFIPDSGFVGTAFVNALGNALVTVGHDAELSATPHTTAHVVPAGLNETCHINQSWGFQIQRSTLQSGQTVDYVKKIHLPSTEPSSANNNNPSILFEDIVLRYQGSDGEIHNADVLLNTTPSPLELQLIDYHIFRLETIQTINEALHIASQEHPNLPQANQLIELLSNKLRTWLENNPPVDEDLMGLTVVREYGAQIKKTPSQLITALLGDLEGQVSEALSREDWYAKWGRHFLPSLARAHELQQCLNFKDPGVQDYGGDLFNHYRNLADNAFNSLPPPVSTPAASLSTSGTPRSPRAQGSSPAPRINMASFNSADMPCFHGDCLLALRDGPSRPLREVQRGDLLPGGGAVLCVVRTLCPGGVARLVTLKGGLRITPWHPVQSSDQQWVFPSSLGQEEEVDCEAVYSLLVEKEGGGGYCQSVVVSGVRCLALAHGIEGDAVASHEFFGSEQVVACLKGCEGWGRGLVVLRAGCLQRDSKTGLVNELVREREVLIGEGGVY